MTKVFAYARFVNLLVLHRKNSQDKEFEGCDEILCFISEASSSGKRIRYTDLVQFVEFGTGPTVLRKCNLLVDRGFIKIGPSEADKREKVISLSRKGINFLIERGNLMRQAVKESDH